MLLCWADKQTKTDLFGVPTQRGFTIPSMIKSDLMSRKILVLLLLLLLLFGCGRKEKSELQRFAGETVATLQTPAISLEQNYVADATLSALDSGETPPPLQSMPTLTPVVATDTTSTISQPVQQSYGFENATVTPLASNTPVFSMTPLSTLGIGVWDGAWNIWYQNSNGNYSSSIMTVQVAGAQFSATATINNINYTFKGDLIVQGNEVEGQWTTSHSEGNFWFQMVSPETFVGSSESRFGLCGVRGSADRPDSCRKIPQN